MIAALCIETGGGKRNLLNLGNLPVDILALGVLADNLLKALFIDDNGERYVVDLVAFAGVDADVELIS